MSPKNTDTASTATEETVKPGTVSAATVSATDATPAASGAVEAQPTQLVGRAAFAVDTAPAGIVVRTVFVAEQGQVLEIPAVFPDLGYALQQIDQLRQLVIERFAQAAQVGVQVIAAQAQNRATPADAGQSEPAAAEASATAAATS